jgi:nucleoside-diphosphate-sugar epimerase
MTEKVLLTGGLGFIGHHIALKLLDAGLEPVVFDNFSHNILNPWHKSVVEERIELLNQKNVRLIEGDARNMEDFKKAMLESKPSRVIHLSAIPSDLISNRDPGAAFDHNLLSTKNLLEILRLEKVSLKQFVYFSSSMVYGDFKTEIVPEDAPTDPKGIYGAAKRSSEMIIRAYHNLLGIPYTIVRPSALYGPRCINNRVTQIFIEKAIQGLPLQIEGDGEEKLDFTCIDDLVEGIYLVLSRTEALNKTYNLTYGKGEKINQLVNILKDYYPTLKIEYKPRDRMKAIRGTLDITRAKQDLGYNPQNDLQKGYRQYIEWYLKTPFLDFVKSPACV